MTEAVPSWEIYASHPHFVLGFHGCDRSVGEAVIVGDKPHLRASANDYDWLGHGTYFWEDSPQRAMEFAQERSAGAKHSKGLVANPFVIGAVINLNHCLNLMDRTALEELKGAFGHLQHVLGQAGIDLPTNGSALRMRKLDCAVFEALHQYRSRKTGRNALSPYDTIRGLFFEGEDLYPGAGIRAKDHIQICVRNPKCILGYFRPISG